MQPHIVIDAGSNTSLHASASASPSLRHVTLSKRQGTKSVLSLAESLLKGQLTDKSSVQDPQLTSVSTPKFGRRACVQSVNDTSQSSDKHPEKSPSIRASNEPTSSLLNIASPSVVPTSPALHGRRSRQATTESPSENPLIAMLHSTSRPGMTRSTSQLPSMSTKQDLLSTTHTPSQLTPNSLPFLEKSHSSTTLSAVRAGYQAAMGVNIQNDTSTSPKHSTSNHSIHHRTSTTSVETSHQGKIEMDQLLTTALGHSSLAKQASAVLLNASETHGQNLLQLLDRSQTVSRSPSRTSIIKSTPSLAPKTSIRHLGMLGDAHPRYRWKLAIETVIKGIKIVQAFSAIPSADTQVCPPGLFNQEKLPIMNAPTFSRQTFHYLLKSFETNADLLVNTKIQILLSVPPQHRQAEDMIRLEKLLSHHMHSLKKFTLDQRLSLCQTLRYARYPAGKLVMREGHRAYSFYIILSGKVDVLKKQPDRLLRLNASDSFGDVGIEGILSKTRTASILTTCETELLVLDKEDYRQVILSKDSEFDIHQRLKMINSFPMFKQAQLDDTIIHQLVMKSETRVYHNNVSILEQGALNPFIYFIIQGSVILKRTMDKQVLTGPSIIDKMALPSKNEITLELGTLDSGHTFPEILTPSLFESSSLCYRVRQDPVSVLHTLEEQNNHIDIELKKMLKQVDYEYPNHTTFVAEGVVTCLVLRRMDLLRYLPPLLVRHLYDTIDESCVTEEDIRQDYKRQQEWNTYKKTVIDQTFDQLKAVKRGNTETKASRFKTIK